jgi:hypothetical protein
MLATFLTWTLDTLPALLRLRDPEIYLTSLATQVATGQMDLCPYTDILCSLSGCQLSLINTLQDPSGPTPDKRDVDSGDKVSGKAASGNDAGNKAGPAGEKDEEEGGDEEEEEDEAEIEDPKEKLEEGKTSQPMLSNVKRRRDLKDGAIEAKGI